MTGIFAKYLSAHHFWRRKLQVFEPRASPSKGHCGGLKRGHGGGRKLAGLPRQDDAWPNGRSSVRRTDVPDSQSKQDYNRAIGERVRRRRKELGLSQTALGAKIGVSCQQIQKYENGRNSVAASRLHQLSLALATTAPALIGLKSWDEGEDGGERARLLQAWSVLPNHQREPLLRYVEALALSADPHVTGRADDDPGGGDG
ncbi:helix-turn-helix domain-containing protein [Brevundimonas diminuta]|uniref:helix-turn-helix domain-containing protein n=1 Tax=Brevundimonas TaxID=41275 RepID=UPI001FD02C98|nr:MULTISPECIES: helix-turn-helix transcriptional regulator [Brevundimonas]WQE46474.1 helix-turn-helix transcriptional regulator [Brevundimonas diminuta]